MSARPALSTPSFLLQSLEPGRAMAEWSVLPMARLMLRLVPRGDGHPVMVLPGMMAGDGSTAALRSYLSGHGYKMVPWQLGRNLGPRAIGEDGEALEQRVADVYNKYQQPISLIGWSLGGVMAREIAKRMPGAIRQVITLGSPFNGGPDVTNVGRIYKGLAGKSARTAEFRDFVEQLAEPPVGVPSTSIFSKTDGIVHWRGCLETPADMTDNVEVYASHCGLGFNPIVMFALAERLLMRPGAWQPFDRESEVWRRYAFPSGGHSYGVKAI